MFKKFGILLSAGAMGLVAATSGTSAQAAEVTLKGASCFPVGSPVSKPWANMINNVNKRGKGDIQIKLVGGAPAIGSPFTLTQKMARGAYDLVGCPEAYFGNVLIEAAALRLNEGTFAEIRQNGGLDYIKRLLKAKNLYYLARHHNFGNFHLFLSKPISGPNLKGLHLRVAPVYTAFFKELGATVQQSNLAQIYTYMENGTVQGYGWPITGWIPSWTKVTKYRVDPGFYSANLHTLVNQKAWDGLTKSQQKVLTEVGMEYEAKSSPTSAAFKARVEKQKAFTASKGMKTITFSGADKAKWLNTAKSAAWKEVVERSPKHGPALKKLFTK